MGRVAVAVLLLAAIGALLPPAASAHLSLRSSQPAADTQLDTVPREIRLSFSEPVQLAFTRVELLDPNGNTVRLSEPTIDPGAPNVLLARIEGPLGAGDFVIAWRTTSADGHQVRGRISFSIDAEAEGLVAEQPEEAPVAPQAAAHHDPELFPERGEFTAESPGYVVVRWLMFVGLLGVIGLAAFRLLVLRIVLRSSDPEGVAAAAPAAHRAAGAGIAFSLVLLAAVGARLYAQALAVHAGDAPTRETIAALLGGTFWGGGWMLQAAATLLILAGFVIARAAGRAAEAPAPGADHTEPARADAPGAGWLLVGIAAVVLAFTPALAGHAAAVPGNRAAAIASDGLHVLAAGGWLGGLLAVVAIGIPAAVGLGPERRGRAVAALVNAFSPTALGFAALVTVTGVLSAAFHLGSFSDLWASEYGRMLLLKLGVLSLVFATGAYNWLRVRPALGDEAGARRMRRSGAFELTIGAAVILVTALLVATPPPAGVEEAAPPPAVEAAGSPVPAPVD
jgi:putative copper export protein/methionine-rich copper-binding protein CopC